MKVPQYLIRYPPDARRRSSRHAFLGAHFFVQYALRGALFAERSSRSALRGAHFIACSLRRALRAHTSRRAVFFEASSSRRGLSQCKPRDAHFASCTSWRALRGVLFTARPLRRAFWCVLRGVLFATFFFKFRYGALKHVIVAKGCASIRGYGINWWAVIFGQNFFRDRKNFRF